MKTSKDGYKKNSPDRNNPFNVINSNRITMQNVPHPVIGIDNLGNIQHMLPGGEYVFKGSHVIEFPIKAQYGGDGFGAEYVRRQQEMTYNFTKKSKKRKHQDGGETEQNAFDGGLSPEDARQALIEGHIMGNPISDAQRTLFAQVAGTDEDGNLLDEETGEPIDESSQDDGEEEMRHGGQHNLRDATSKHNLHNRSHTSKNIQSSINELMLRNHDVFGPYGKHIYNPKAQVGREVLPQPNLGNVSDYKDNSLIGNKGLSGYHESSDYMGTTNHDVGLDFTPAKGKFSVNAGNYFQGKSMTDWEKPSQFNPYIGVNYNGKMGTVGVSAYPGYVGASFTKTFEGGGEWLERYQEGGGNTQVNKNLHPYSPEQIEFNSLPKWKQDAIRNRPQSTQAQVSASKPMSQEDINRSESISRKLEHPWIYNPAGTLASYATRLSPMSEEDVIKTHGNPMQAANYSAGVMQDALINEMAGPAIGKTAATLKKAGKEAIYKGINPVGYGAKQKALDFIPNLVKYTMNPEQKIVDIAAGFEGHPESFKQAVKELTGSYNPNATVLEKMSQSSPSQIERIEKGLRSGKNRSDAFRTALGLPQEHNTFTQIGEGKYKINPEKFQPNPDHFRRVDMDRKKFISDQIEPYMGDDPTKFVSNHPDYFKGVQRRIVEKSKNPEFTHSIYDNDPSGIMGSFRWDVKHTPEGNLHFQSNDRWDLHPWESRGPINARQDALDKKILDKHYKKPLRKVEALGLIGGKPYDIKNNFIVDPKTYKILDAFKGGGQTKNWLDNY